MRASRFSAEFRQPIRDGDSATDTVKAYLEYDFLGNYDRTSLRLRQFYAEYKDLLVGQTWSAFGDPDVFPDTLEFEGPPGIIGLRNPMFRYTYPLNDSNRIGVSVEKSGTDTPFSTQFGVPVGSSVWPDLVAFYRYENKHGHIHTAFISRSVGGVIPNTLVPDLRNHVDGFGGSLSGRGEPARTTSCSKSSLAKEFRTTTTTISAWEQTSGLMPKASLSQRRLARVSLGISTTGPSYCGPRSAMVTRKSIARWATLELRTTSATTPPLT